MMNMYFNVILKDTGTQTKQAILEWALNATISNAVKPLENFTANLLLTEGAESANLHRTLKQPDNSFYGKQTSLLSRSCRPMTQQPTLQLHTI